MTTTETAPDLAPAYALFDLIQGAVVSQAISVSAKLGIADVLADGHLSAETVAEQVGADAVATSRLLRLLAGCGVFAQLGSGEFVLTPMGQTLREDAPVSMRGLAVLLGHPLFWEEWPHLVDSIRTGEANLPKLRGTDAYSFLMQHPEYAQVFFGGMLSMSESETAPIVEAYDFAQFGTLVDVVGGRGTLLAGILASVPRLQGILFDIERSTVGAEEIFARAGVGDRASVEPGSYFDAPPKGADAYVLKHILHDFSEDDCLRMLQTVREAMTVGSKMLIVEYVLRDDNRPHPGKLIDLWLLLLLGARERTYDQYAELIAEADLELVREIPTRAPVSILEVVRR